MDEPSCNKLSSRKRHLLTEILPCESEDIVDEPPYSYVEDCREQFLEEILNSENQKSSHFMVLTKGKYLELLQQVEDAEKAEKKTPLQQRRLKRFTVLDNGTVKKLIARNDEGVGRSFLTAEEVYDVIDAVHIAGGHSRRDRMLAETSIKYANVTKEMINLYLSMCETCQQRPRQKAQEKISKWQQNDIQCLIDLYIKYKAKFASMQKNKVWEMIATEISSIRDKYISGEQCSGKWKGLKFMYRKINADTTNPNNRQYWKFYDQIDSILQSEKATTAISSSDEFFYERKHQIIEYAPQEGDPDYVFKWLPGEIQCLINLFEKHKSKFGSISKKNVWKIIASELSSIQQRNINGERCSGKWKGLKAMYKKINDQNNTGGYSRTNWQFYEQMDTILCKEQEEANTAICSSDDDNGVGDDDGDNLENEYLTIDPLKAEYNLEDSVSNESDSNQPTTSSQNQNRKRKSSVDIEAAKERRHAERMEMQREFLDLFRTLVNHLDPANNLSY